MTLVTHELFLKIKKKEQNSKHLFLFHLSSPAIKEHKIWESHQPFQKTSKARSAPRPSTNATAHPHLQKRRIRRQGQKRNKAIQLRLENTILYEQRSVSE